ncbi:MAG TPA: hypothetical protein VF143_04170 [Candidatus Nanopelagicales bacterium]
MEQVDVDPVTAPACVRCGGAAEHDFVTMWLCTDCYHIAGSTCAGAGASGPGGATGPAGGMEEQSDAVC